MSRLIILIGSQVYNFGNKKRIDRAKEVNEELIRRSHSIAFPHISLEYVWYINFVPIFQTFFGNKCVIQEFEITMFGIIKKSNCITKYDAIFFCIKI